MSHPHSGSEPRTLAQLLCEADGGFAQHPDGTPLRTAPCERHVWMAEWLEARGVRVGTPEVSEEAVRAAEAELFGKNNTMRDAIEAAWAAQFGRGKT